MIVSILSRTKLLIVILVWVTADAAEKGGSAARVLMKKSKQSKKDGGSSSDEDMTELVIDPCVFANPAVKANLMLQDFQQQLTPGAPSLDFVSSLLHQVALDSSIPEAAALVKAGDGESVFQRGASLGAAHSNIAFGAVAEKWPYLMCITVASWEAGLATTCGYEENAETYRSVVTLLIDGLVEGINAAQANNASFGVIDIGVSDVRGEECSQFIGEVKPGEN